MNCRQASEQEKLLDEKDAEIARLRQRLAELEIASSEKGSEGRASDDSSCSVLDSHVSREPPIHPKPDAIGGHSRVLKGVVSEPVHTPRRGKAPPIDPFSGENVEVRFEDWLPSLERAAEWNCWSEAEKLIQLAGHLRGKALQEWNLLLEEEKPTYRATVEKLREVLGPGSRVLAAQDFRHTCQDDNETVAAFIRRLERTFRVAYGHEKLKPETRDMLLYGQLQEGLRHDLMRSPNVSGALTYKELCMSAKNEEKRLVQLKKRQQYLGQRSRTQSTPRISLRDEKGAIPLKSSSDSALSKPPVRCYTCNKLGHYSKDCPARKTESGGKQKTTTKQGTTAALVTSEEQMIMEDPCSYLHSDSEDNQVKLVQVPDQGSRNHRARVLVQGVPAQGLIDTGADITIMGGELFKLVAAANHLKKSQFKKADKVAHSYNHNEIKLDGRIDLELRFAGQTMKVTVYVKMNAKEQLLLEEGVCRQLGMVKYHPDVQPCDGKPVFGGTPILKDPEASVQVPVVHIQVIGSQSILPQQTTCVSVEMVGGSVSGKELMIEPSPSLGADGIQMPPSLIQPEGETLVMISNPTGFTCHLEPGYDLGTVEAVEEVPEISYSEVSTVRMPSEDVEADSEGLVEEAAPDKEVVRKEMLAEIFEQRLDVPAEVKQRFLQFLQEHHNSFCLSEHERGETDLIQFEIHTGEAKPQKQRARRMPFTVRQEVSYQLKKMQEAGVIQPSHSPWASPVVLVRKRDGSHRFCVDYRELNSVTRPDTFPLPRIDDLLDQLGKARYFSTLDLAAGYWQIKVHPNSQEKTAFVTHEGLHEFRVMPFGLTNAPAAFQRLMQQVLMGLNPEDGHPFVSVYIDDIIVFSSSLEEHLHHLKLVLQKLEEVNLKLKPTKCQFLRQQVEYLGCVVTPEGLRTSERHVRAIQEFPAPKNVQEVRRFLGLASYYRRFVASFAKIAQPLHALTRKGTVFEWSAVCQAAFNYSRRSSPLHQFWPTLTSRRGL